MQQRPRPLLVGANQALIGRRSPSRNPPVSPQGDNDPVDVVEIGSTQLKMGGVYKVRRPAPGGAAERRTFHARLLRNVSVCGGGGREPLSP